MRVVIVRDEFCSNISHHTKILYTFLHHVEASFVEHTKHSVTIWQTVMDKGQTYMWETHEYDNNDLESTASIFYGIVLSIQHILLRLFGFSLESAKEWPRKNLHTRLRARIKPFFVMSSHSCILSVYFLFLVVSVWTGYPRICYGSSPSFCTSNLSAFDASTDLHNFGPNITVIFIPGALNCSIPVFTQIKLIPWHQLCTHE